MAKGQKATTSKETPVALKSLPRKVKDYVVGRKTPARPVHKVYVLHFGEPFAFELYWYEKDPLNDGYTNALSKYIKRGADKDFHDELDACHFTECINRRVAGSDDEVQTNTSNTYTRVLFVRYPLGDESTPATRQKGLAAVKSFLMDKRFSLYPPENVLVEDLTENSKVAMDSMMMNDDIQARLEEDVDKEHLDADFKVDFPDCAKRCWLGEYVNEWAKGLGF